jgi:nucleoside-diphosphate-sugar epimerase
MRVLIIGAAGMLGRKLAAAVAARGIGGQAVTDLTLADMLAPPEPAGFAGQVRVEAVDISVPGVSAALVAARPDVIFHLAAVVSGEAEADFETGYAVNLDGTRMLFEAIRLAGGGYCPRLVYASSGAVYGAPFPEVIGDDYLVAPRTSYGAQKAIGELLLNDYSRRGFLDGVGLRLPTICIRPGKPNRAASGFFSNILREPLAGLPAVLPVRDSLRHWFASPRAAVAFLERAAAMDSAPLGFRRVMNMPGLSATVADEIDALRRVAGQKAVDLIRVEPDPAIAAIVETWAQAYDPVRALDLGFRAETSFDEIIAVHLEDERAQAT